MEYHVICAKEGCKHEKAPDEPCPLCGCSSSILRINGSYEIEIGPVKKSDLPALVEELDRVNGALESGKYLGSLSP